ncbi:serine hydrolase [Bacillus sp. S3]|uniref:serine hydrolase n=1 Tax=Bacillus sp. S3 TaxID=486398 RepID=UPI00118B67A7|nr:serine hydrolase [Bacillus sp. S3]QCJ41123.1 serine hydrolase [Bacillus sp. S3]
MERLMEKIEEELRGLSGRAGLAIEMEGKCIDINSKEVFQSASLIKVPILIEGLRQSDRGTLNVNQLVSITSPVGGSGVLQVLSRDARLTLMDLMTLMITVSDNTATNILIDELGMEAINRSMVKMGLQHTVLNRKMMDFQALEQGRDNYTSPADMLTCLKVIMEGSYLTEESQAAALRMMKFQQFQDRLPGMMDLDRVMAANKTGSLPHVVHDCAIITYKGKTAYAAVLLDRLDDEFTGNQIISRIGKHIYDYLLFGI